MKSKLHEFIVVGVGIVLSVFILVPSNVTSKLFTKSQSTKTIMNNNVSTTQGVKDIKKLEQKNVLNIEEKINQIRKKEPDESNFKSIFSNSVIMGDSISESLAEYDILEKSSVVAYKGRNTESALGDVKTIINLQPQKVFMTYGMNDLLLFNGNAKTFVEHYEKLINAVKKGLPNSQIYVCSVLPVQQIAINENSAFKNYPKFNIALEDMCKNLDITYIKTDDLLDGHSEYYEPDGIHMKMNFYPSWLNRLYDKEIKDIKSKEVIKMKKNITKILVSMALACSLLLSGCSREITMSVDQIGSELKSEIDTKNMEVGTDKSLRRYFGINANDLDGYVLYVPKSNMDVDELLIAKVKDESMIDSVEESIEDRVNRQLESFNGYGVEQTALLENYELKINGKYIFYTVGENAEQVKEAYTKIIKK